MKQEKRKKSIVKKSIMRIGTLGLFILIGVSVIAGYVFYRSMIMNYSRLANSLSEMACLRISSEKTEQLIALPSITEFEDKYSSFGFSDENLKKLSEKEREEAELYTYWTEIAAFLGEAIRHNKNLRYFQVFVPEEEDVRLIWDSGWDESAEYLLYMSKDTRPYRDGEKEELEEINNDSLEYWFSDRGVFDRSLRITEEGDQTVGSAIFPIFSPNDAKTMAYAEVGVSITGVQSSIIELMLYIAGIIVVIMFLGMYLYFRKTRKEVIQPVLQLQKASSDAVQKLREGNNVFDLDINTDDEIEELSHSFEEMERSLVSYIDENASITAKQERMAAELNLASTIQADMLPDVFPAFQDRKEFDIYASMVPAKQVGGDFYDYFLVDDDNLALVMADVSGKGVPAAMFMMRSMLLIETVAMNDHSPSSVLHEVNNKLCVNNKSGMFVTVWLGILNLRTGLLRAANGGHEFPIIKKPGGEYELFKDKHSFVLGGYPGMDFDEYEVQLEPGSALILYTDGATEVKNPEGKMIRTEGFLDVLNKSSDESPEAKLKDVGQSIRDFIKDAEQFDDLTMMCLFYFGDAGADELTTKAVLKSFPEVKGFLQERLTAAGAEKKPVKQVCIATEELFENIARYAYGEDVPEEERPVTVGIDIRTEPGEDGEERRLAEITLRDSGVPYNPLQNEDPDVTLEAKDREAGGLGIFMSKNMVDDMKYEYTEGNNTVRLIKWL